MHTKADNEAWRWGVIAVTDRDLELIVASNEKLWHVGERQRGEDVDSSNNLIIVFVPVNATVTTPNNSVKSQALHGKGLTA